MTPGVVWVIPARAQARATERPIRTVLRTLRSILIPPGPSPTLIGPGRRLLTHCGGMTTHRKAPMFRRSRDREFLGVAVRARGEQAAAADLPAAGTGRSGSRSSRQVIGGASRGGATIGAAYALRNRDAQGLADYGLSLAEFDGLSPRARISRLVTLMIGDDGHPDDRAIRQAATEQVKKIVATDAEAPTASEAIKGFVSAYIFQLGLVELQNQITNGTMDGAEALTRERMLRGWIEAKVRGLDVDTTPALRANTLHQTAADLAQRAVRVLRAR